MPRDVRNRPGEFELIARYFRPLAGEDGALGLSDDAAIYRPRSGEDLVITVDTVAAGVHFFADDPPDAIARKALRVNLSDLAGKGAEATGYLLSLALPADWTEAWLARFARGLAADQRRYGIALMGGDTTRAADGLSITITAFGRTPKGGMVRRAGARPGDAVFASGTVGDAALGLRIAQGTLDVSPAHARFLRRRYLVPEPRTALAAAIRRYATSAMDVSDGLVGDLAHICESSGVGAEINAEAIPLSPAARAALARDPALLSVVLNGGDDYEILATVPTTAVSAFQGAARAAGVPVARIGAIVADGRAPVVRGADGQAIKLVAHSHTHF